MDVHPVESAGGDEIAQPLEPRADERGAAVALVDKAAGGLEAGAVLRQARLQGRELARDGAALHLLIGRDASVDGDAHGRHGRPLLTAVSAIGASGMAWSEAHTGAKRRTMVGASRSKAIGQELPAEPVGLIADPHGQDRPLRLAPPHRDLHGSVTLWAADTASTPEAAIRHEGDPSGVDVGWTLVQP